MERVRNPSSSGGGIESSVCIFFPQPRHVTKIATRMEGPLARALTACRLHPCGSRGASPLQTMTNSFLSMKLRTSATRRRSSSGHGIPSSTSGQEGKSGPISFSRKRNRSDYRRPGSQQSLRNRIQLQLEQQVASADGGMHVDEGQSRHLVVAAPVLKQWGRGQKAGSDLAIYAFLSCHNFCDTPKTHTGIPGTEFDF